MLLPIHASVTTLKVRADLHVWGSGHWVQTLLAHDLVDEFRLMIYPLTLGNGKRLFVNGVHPTGLKARLPLARC
ncbi:MAG TPA: dihydrofolate reductase family protein [Anaerolineales bacterium]|nr:dihydrofolate reductase family protein [Anaerolineales bacterium]